MLRRLSAGLKFASYFQPSRKPQLLDMLEQISFQFLIGFKNISRSRFRGLRKRRINFFVQLGRSSEELATANQSVAMNQRLLSECKHQKQEIWISIFKAGSVMRHGLAYFAALG